MDIKKIPLLNKIDLSDPEKRKSFLIGCAFVIVAIFAAIWLVSGSFKSDSGEGDPAATEETSSTGSDFPDDPVGADKDRLEENSTADLRKREHDRSAGAFARQMFADNSQPASEDILSGMSGEESDTTSASGASGAGAQGASGMTDGSGIPTVPTTAQQGGAAAVQAQPQGTPTDSRQDPGYAASAEAQRRLRLIEMGFDPDTGERLPGYAGNDGIPTVQQQGGGSEGESGSGDEERSEFEAEPRQDEPAARARVTLQSSGAMSPFGTDAAGSDGFSSFGSETTSDLGEETPYFKVAFKYDEKVRTGQRVTLELGERITVNGMTLPISTVLYAICSVDGDRLKLRVNNITVNGKAVPLNYEAFDVDWEDGLYCPQSRSASTVKEVAQQAGQVAQSALQSVVGRVPGQIITVGASAMSNKNGDVTVSVMKGYTFYLMPAPEQNGRR